MLRARVKELLDFDKQTGLFTRRFDIGSTKAGTIAGHKNRGGYIIIVIDGVPIMAHTLAWLVEFGEYCLVDHKDRVRCNNRIDNLRRASDAENSRNKTVNNKYGYKGVTKKGAAYTAQITVNYKNIYLGSFKTPEEAGAAYKAAALEHFGEFANA